MRKVMMILAVSMTAALISAGALLPWMIAYVQDAAVTTDGFSQMQPIELDLNIIQPTDDAREPVSVPAAGDITSKLLLLHEMYTIPLRTSETVMSQEAVFAAVEKAMEEYIAAGIFEWFVVTSRYAEPSLGIDPNNIQNNSIFWSVSFINKNEPYENLFLYVDDQTGKILHIRYEKYSSFSMDGVWERNQKLLDLFTSIYFSQLGWNEAAAYYESEAGVETAEVDGGVSYTRHSFADMQDGEWYLEFYAVGDGSFYTYFPGL